MPFLFVSLIHVFIEHFSKSKNIIVYFYVLRFTLKNSTNKYKKFMVKINYSVWYSSSWGNKDYKGLRIRIIEDHKQNCHKNSSVISHNVFSYWFTHNLTSTSDLSSLILKMTLYSVDTMSCHLWIQMITTCIAEHVKSNLIDNLQIMVKENILEMSSGCI